VSDSLEALGKRLGAIAGWTEKQQETALELLPRLAFAMGAEVCFDGETGPVDSTRFAVVRVRAALDRRAAHHACQMRRGSAPLYARPLEEPRLDGRTDAALGEHVPQLNLNYASAAELSALPVVGPELAGDIVRRRVALGGRISLEEVDQLPGIGPKAMQVLREATFTQDEAGLEDLVRAVPEARELVEAPTFENLATFVARGTAGIAGEWLLDEIRRAIEDAELHPPDDIARAGGIRASMLEARSRTARRAAELEEARIQQVERGLLLFDRSYLPFVERLIKSASERLRLTMFFLRYDEEQRSRVEGLVEALVARHEASVDVQVILDRDREEDVFRSRLVNEAAYRHLREAGVAVRFDSPERVSHSKILVVDRSHCVVGSHNWTGGSLYAYDDTSVYLKSEGLGARYEQRFEELWRHAASVD